MRQKNLYIPTDVTVGIVVRNGAKTLPDLLESLRKQSIPPKKLIIVNNASTDSTLQIIRTFKKKYGKTKIITRKVNSIAGGRNDCMHACTTRLLAFTDADCIVPTTWLSSLLTGININNSEKLAAVGGSNTPPPTSFWNTVLGLLLNTPLGTGSSVQGRQFTKPRLVPHIPCVNVLYKTNALKKVGGFDERFNTMIEDEDLSYRMGCAGLSLLYLPGISILHDMSVNPVHWAKKMIAYGKGRMNFIIHHPQTIGVKTVLPIILFVTVLLSPIMMLARIGIGLYALVLVISCVNTARTTKKIPESAALFILYPITHLCYGCGLLLQTVQYIKNEFS